MKILIVKTSSLGDIVHAFPILPYIKGKFPSAQIDWVVEKPYADLVRAHPLVDLVIPIQTKKWRSRLFSLETWKEIRAVRKELQLEHYDVVFDLQGNLKSGYFTGAARALKKVGFGLSTLPEWPNIFFTNLRFNPPAGLNIRDDYRFLVQSFFSDFSPIDEAGIRLTVSSEEEQKIRQILSSAVLSGGKAILVCPGSNWANKQISLDCMAQFLKGINKECQGRFLFAWGSEEEKKTALALQEKFPKQSLVLDKLSLPGLQNLMSRVSLVIAMDSLPLHLAATTSTPTFSVFGASSADKYKPIGKRHMAFQGACPYGRTFQKRCPVLRTCPTGLCVKGIDGTALFDAFLGWWKAVEGTKGI